MLNRGWIENAFLSGRRTAVDAPSGLITVVGDFGKPRFAGQKNHAGPRGDSFKQVQAGDAPFSSCPFNSATKAPGRDSRCGTHISNHAFIVSGKSPPPRAEPSGRLASMRVNPANRVVHQISRVLQLELLLDVGAVHLDGLDAQMQAFGDFAGAAPLPDELEDFEFSVSEPLHGRANSPGLATGKKLQNVF